MIKRIKKGIALSLTSLMVLTNTVGVFAQNNVVYNENISNELMEEGELSNSIDLGVEDINEELKEIYPYGEIVEVQETEYGTAYYVDSEYHKTRKKRSVWDALDVVMAGASWADFFQDPSLKNLGWATLDTAALLPLLPSSAYFRKGGKLILKTSEVKKLAKTSKGKAAIKRALKKGKAVCFVKGTKILTNEGHKNIEDIKVDDLVYSKDIISGKEDLKAVRNVFRKETNTIVTINTDNSEIHTTKEHPFFIKGEGFKAAKDIKLNDKIVTYSNLYSNVTDIKVNRYSTPVEVFNFEVDDWHSYFAGDENLLVHNTCAQSKSISSKALKELKRMGLDKKFQNALSKGLAPGRYGESGIIRLSSNEIISKGGYKYTYKLKVPKAGGHTRVYGRLTSTGELIFDYVKKG